VDSAPCHGLDIHGSYSRGGTSFPRCTGRHRGLAIPLPPWLLAAPVPLRVPTNCHVRRARSRLDLPYMTFSNLTLRFCVC